MELIKGVPVYRVVFTGETFKTVQQYIEGVLYTYPTIFDSRASVISNILSSSNTKLDDNGFIYKEPVIHPETDSNYEILRKMNIASTYKTKLRVMRHRKEFSPHYDIEKFRIFYDSCVIESNLYKSKYIKDDNVTLHDSRLSNIDNILECKCTDLHDQIKYFVGILEQLQIPTLPSDIYDVPPEILPIRDRINRLKLYHNYQSIVNWKNNIDTIKKMFNI